MAAPADASHNHRARSRGLAHPPMGWVRVFDAGEIGARAKPWMAISEQRCFFAATADSRSGVFAVLFPQHLVGRPRNMLEAKHTNESLRGIWAT